MADGPAPTAARGPAQAAVRGVVLCGGASRRMGRDKALLVVEGEAMAVRVAAALRRAGAREVVAAGGDERALRALGLPVVPDERPGEGPLAGIVTALRLPSPGGDGITLVAACDLAHPSPDALAATAAALAGEPDADLAVPVLEGREQWGHAAWRRRALAPLDAQLTAGRRAVHRAVAAAGLTVARLTDLPAPALADADVPSDLPGARPVPGPGRNVGRG